MLLFVHVLANLRWQEKVVRGSLPGLEVFPISIGRRVEIVWLRMSAASPLQAPYRYP